MRKPLLLVVVLFLAWVGAGCTREGKQDSKVSIGFGNLANQKAGALSAVTFTHIAINISGDKMATVVWNWDGHHGNSVTTPPSSIEFNITKGRRLVQVLAVADTASGQAFMYGSVDQEFVSGDNTANITVSNIGGGSGAQANMAGRYLNADGLTGPTGELELMFQPPVAGHPAMQIMDTPIINGWFRIFLVDGANFSYRFKDSKTPLFPNVTMATLPPPSDRVLRVIQPHSYQWWSGNGGVEERDEEHLVLGFFGPGANTVSRSVCYSAAGSVSGMYSDAAHTTALMWDPTTISTTYVRRFDVAGSAVGGYQDAVGPCASGTQWVDRLNFDGTKVGGGKTKALGFDSIFANVSGQDYTVSTSFSAGNMTASWTYVGSDVIGPNGVDGVAIFSSDSFSGEASMGGDGVNCKALTDPSKAAGFTHKMDIVGSGTTATFAATDQNTKVIACPFKNSYMGQPRYYFNGGQNNFWGNGGGGGGGPAAQIGFRYTSFVANENGCTSADVYLLDSNGDEAQPAASNIPVDLVGTGGAVTLTFKTGDCSGMTTSMAVITSGSNSVRVGIANAGPYGSGTIKASSASPVLPAENGGTPFTVAETSQVTRLSIPGTGAGINYLTVGQCRPIDIGYQNYGGPVAITGSPNINLTAYGATFHSDPTCSGGAITMTTATSGTTSSSTIYVKATQSGWVNLNAEIPNYSPSLGSPYLLSGMMGVIAGTTGEAVTYDFAYPGSSPSQYNVCYEVIVRQLDPYGNPVASASGVPTVNISFGNSNGFFYPDDTCTPGASTTTTVSIGAGQINSTSFWYKGPSASPVNFKAESGAGTDNIWGISPTYVLGP